MFAVDEVLIEARYEVASVRLAHLVDKGALGSVSEAAFQGGLAGLIRVGPFGAARGLSKLVQVRVLDPVRRGATMTVSLRWEATGVAGELFPVLDADLSLLPEGEDQSRLGLIGSYRPPLGWVGAVLDQTIMSGVAEATIRSLLAGVAEALADPLPSPAPGVEAGPRWWPVPEAG